MRQSFDYKKGLDNLFSMYEAHRKKHVKVNYVTASATKSSQDKFGVTEIIYLNQDDKDESQSDDNDLEAGVYSIRVNKISIGKACSPYEVMQVQKKWNIPCCHNI